MSFLASPVAQAAFHQYYDELEDEPEKAKWSCNCVRKKIKVQGVTREIESLPCVSGYDGRRVDRNGPCKSRWLGDFVDREVGAIR